MSSKATRLTGACVVETYDWGGHAHQAPAKARADTGSGPHPDTATVEREAFMKGYAQGEKAGREVAGTHVEDMLRRLTASIEEMASLRAEIYRRSEPQMVHLALAIARRVVQREISLDRSLLLGMARAALDRLADYSAATIRLHPADYAAVAASLTADGTHPHVQIAPDPMVSPGGCLVQSDLGSMDVSHHAQFEELARVILDDEGQPRAVVGSAHGHSS
jgi:flagellar assembly protein FliH